MAIPDISVIVPVYGVEKYITGCAESLFNQTMTNSVEFIFVNDATKDNSIGVLRDVISQYPRLESRIRIISHNENKGLPSARNTGLAAPGVNISFTLMATILRSQRCWRIYMLR